MLVSKVGNPCPTLGQLLASRILYAQGAAKGGRQKEFDHFFASSTNSFGHFLAPTLFESPQMWVWPQLPFGGAPQATGGPFPPAVALPSLQTLALPLPPMGENWLFAQCSSTWAAWAGVREAAHRGWRGSPPSGTWGQTHIWGHSTFSDPRRRKR